MTMQNESLVAALRNNNVYYGYNDDLFDCIAL